MANGTGTTAAVVEPGRFLPYEKYIERFAKDVLALQRLWLVPIALCAFWLAIENSYASFNSVKSAKLIHEATRVAAERQQARYKGVQSRAGAEPATEHKAKVLADRAREQFRKQREAVEKLRSEAVNLTVAGTVMPSRLSYAPSLLLAALFAWLMLFETLKLRAQTNLAAAVGAYSHKRIPFGLAEESSLWLAPLPRSMTLKLPVEEGAEDVPRTKMLALLGWTDGEERRNRFVAGLVWCGVLALLIRIVWISSEVNSALAVDLRLTGNLARTLNSVATAVFAAAVVLSLIRLSLSRGAERPRDQLPDRRQALALIGGSAALLAAIWYKPWLQDLLTYGGADRARGSYRPRFVSRAARERRRRQRGIDVKLPGTEPGDLLVRRKPARRRGEPEVISFFGVSGDGRTRLAMKRPAPLGKALPRAFAALTARPARPARLRFGNLRRTASLEAAALALVGQRRFDEACEILLGACRLTLSGPKPNIRLFDLLAGITERYPAAATFRAPLLALLPNVPLIQAAGQGDRPSSDARPGPGATGEPASDDGPAAAAPAEIPGMGRREPDVRAILAARPGQWANPTWKEHWTSGRTLMWGHPLETVQARRRAGARENDRRRRARPVPLPPA